uniref:Putative secreted protein n=1 Tax=Anopheles marajoara TaxID=58244 RepID=A0A2M4C9I5_9DIPT
MCWFLFLFAIRFPPQSVSSRYSGFCGPKTKTRWNLPATADGAVPLLLLDGHTPPLPACRFSFASAAAANATVAFFDVERVDTRSGDRLLHRAGCALL